MEVMLARRFFILAFVAVMVLSASCADGAPEASPNAGPTTEETDKDLTQERHMTIEETVEKARAIRDKYEDLFWRQPNIFGVGIGLIADESGQLTDRAGFVIRVTKKVDQSKLPASDRIPDVIEGIEVQIREEEPPTIEETEIWIGEEEPSTIDE